MITKEKVLEILEQNSILSRTAGRVVIYENDWENIAEDIVKNCSIPDVVGRSEQLVCDKCIVCKNELKGLDHHDGMCFDCMV